MWLSPFGCIQNFFRKQALQEHVMKNTNTRTFVQIILVSNRGGGILIEVKLDIYL